MSNQILTALAKLDPANDNHWTSEGLPRIDTVKFVSGDANLTRDDITKAAPTFSRANLGLLGADAPQAAQPGASDQPTTVTAQSAPATAVQAAALVSAPAGSDYGQVHPQAETVAQVESDGTIRTASDYEAAPLAEKLAFAQARMADLEHEKVHAIRAFDAASAEVDRLIYLSHEETPPETNASAIRHYLDQQAANLQKRGEQLRRIHESGFDLKALLPSASPIDAALAGRKRIRN